MTSNELGRGNSKSGADCIVEGLVREGVSICFANPGTSEMHLLSAFNKTRAIKPVLCLFEGVATGAADGYARMTGRAAATLLHLGPGFTNGAANLHNAKKAFSPIINLVGEHARSHRQKDTPLASDLQATVVPSTVWSATLPSPEAAFEHVILAHQSAHQEPPGPVALIVPADCAWAEVGPSDVRSKICAPPRNPPVQLAPYEEVVQAVRSASRPLIIVGGVPLAGRQGLAALERLSNAGITTFTETFPAAQLRGAPYHVPRRLQYFAEDARDQLSQFDLVVLAGARVPAAFFAYPHQDPELLPADAQVLRLAAPGFDATQQIEALAEDLAQPVPKLQATRSGMAAPKGGLAQFARIFAEKLPTGAVVSDDGVTASGHFLMATTRAAPHHWLSLTGGAIGQGMPVAIGAALSGTASHVFALTGDGAAMYTPQALWTMVRENLPILVIVVANRAYRILEIELERTGASDRGGEIQSMLSLVDPVIAWRHLATGLGMSAVTCELSEDFARALDSFVASPRPMLVELIIM